MPKKRIPHLFINSGYPPLRGYHSHRAILQLQDILETRVISIRAITLKRFVSRKYSIDGIDVEEIYIPVVPFMNKNLPFIRYAALFSYPKIKKKLKEALIIESGSLYPTGEIVRKWMELGEELSCAKIADAIGDDVKVDLPKLSAVDREKIINFYDCILSNSKDMSEQVKRMSTKHPLILEAYRGVDFDKFNKNVVAKGPFLNKPFPRFLYLGGFPTLIENLGAEDVKGGMYLLEAWKIFERISKYGFLIIGGPNGDCKYVKEWRESLLYPERVSIVGRLKAEEIPNYLNGVDIVVIPSLSEGLPNLANEAQACAIPVLGTDAGGIPETVEHLKTGLIVKKKSVQELLKGLLWFSSRNEYEIKNMGEYSSQRIKKLYPWSRYRETAIKGYKYALSKRGININF
ncbi:MAG: glycosyltransferase family 4 protein [Acidobacteriota bacterium]